VGFLDSLKKILSSAPETERAALEKKVRAAPGDPALRQKLGILLLREGETAAGMAELARAAELYEKGGFAGKAVAVVRQLLRHDPGNLDARLRLVALLGREGLSGDAEHEVRAAAAQDALFPGDEAKLDFLHRAAECLPRSPVPRLLAAEILAARGKFYEALADLDQAAAAGGGGGAEFAAAMARLLAMAEDDADRLEACGFLWRRAGRPEEGLPLLERAVATVREAGDGERAAEMEALLESLRQGTAPGAMSFRDAARLLGGGVEPGEGAVREAGGEVAGDATGTGQPPPPEGAGITVEAAVKRLREKVEEEIGESDIEARYELGIAYREMGLLEEAEAEFRLCRTYPDFYLNATVMLAETLAARGDKEGALACLEEVLAAGELEGARMREILYRKGLLLSDLGRGEEATAVFRAIHEEAPDYRDVARRLAEGS